MANINADAIEQLQASVGGTVSLSGTAAYDEAVNIWNGVISRRPATGDRRSS
jgi:hypothetical protein